MLSLNLWRYFDTAIFAFQCILTIGFARYWILRHGAFIGAVLAFSIFVFFTPLTLITYNRIIEDSVQALPRFWAWHIKFVSFGTGGGIAFNDLLLLFFCGAATIWMLKRLSSFTPRIWLIIILLGLVACVGVLSTSNNPAPFIFRAFFYVIRNFGFYYVGAIAGIAIAARGRVREVFDDYFLALVVTFLLSVIGYASLEPDLRWNRYVMDTVSSSVMPTQNAAFVGAYALALLLFPGQLDSRRKIVCILACSIPWIGFFKYAIFYQLLVVLAWGLTILFRLIGEGFQRAVGAFVMVTALCFPLVGTFANYNSGLSGVQDMSLITRYIQTKNLFHTLDQLGSEAQLFGIGWKQPYEISERILADDNYAYGADDPIEQGWAINIQLPILQVLRSAGMLGVLLVTSAAGLMILALKMPSVNERIFVVIPVLFISYLGSFGEFASDYVILCAIWSFASLKVVNNEYNQVSLVR